MNQYCAFDTLRSLHLVPLCHCSILQINRYPNQCQNRQHRSTHARLTQWKLVKRLKLITWSWGIANAIKSFATHKKYNASKWNIWINSAILCRLKAMPHDHVINFKRFTSFHCVNLAYKLYILQVCNFENYRRVRTPLHLPFPLHAAGCALAYNTCKYFMVLVI
jgi:hypothetical protein